MTSLISGTGTAWSESLALVWAVLLCLLTWSWLPNWLEIQKKRINPSGVHATLGFWDEEGARGCLASWENLSACIAAPASVLSGNTKQLLPLC